MASATKTWSFIQRLHVRLVEALPVGLTIPKYRIFQNFDCGNYVIYMRVEKGDEHHDLYLQLTSWTVGDSLDATDFLQEKIRGLRWSS
jgi:hypothetical protein